MAILLGLTRRLKVDVADKFVAYPSNFSGLEEQRLEGTEDHVVHSSTPLLESLDNEFISERDCSDSQQFDFEAPLDGLDINSIMRSFDVVPRRTMSSSGRGRMIQDSALAADAQSVGVDSFVKASLGWSPLENPLDEALQSFDASMDLDPLFGFDASLLGTDTSSQLQ